MFFSFSPCPNCIAMMKTVINKNNIRYDSQNKRIIDVSMVFPPPFVALATMFLFIYCIVLNIFIWIQRHLLFSTCLNSPVNAAMLLLKMEMIELSKSTISLNHLHANCFLALAVFVQWTKWISRWKFRRNVHWSKWDKKERERRIVVHIMQFMVRFFIELREKNDNLERCIKLQSKRSTASIAFGNRSSCNI